VCSLFAAPTIDDLVEGKHPQISGGIVVGYRECLIGRKPAMSLKRSKIEQELLLAANMKSYTSCWQN